MRGMQGNVAVVQRPGRIAAQVGARADLRRSSQSRARDAGAWLAEVLARLTHAASATRSAQGTFEHVDGANLGVDDFRASASMGLGGAPSMVFTDTMPTYSPVMARPSKKAVVRPPVPRHA